MINEGVAGNTGLFVISLCETAIDDHQFATRLDGALALADMDGDVAVDDVAILALHLKLVEDAVGRGLVVTQGIVEALVLLVGLLLGQEVTLEGSHLRLVEERAVGSAPQVAEVVDGLLAKFRIAVLLEC